MTEDGPINMGPPGCVCARARFWFRFWPAMRWHLRCVTALLALHWCTPAVAMMGVDYQPALAPHWLFKQYRFVGLVSGVLAGSEMRICKLCLSCFISIWLYLDFCPYWGSMISIFIFYLFIYFHYYGLVSFHLVRFSGSAGAYYLPYQAHFNFKQRVCGLPWCGIYKLTDLADTGTLLIQLFYPPSVCVWTLFLIDLLII